MILDGFVYIFILSFSIFFSVVFLFEDPSVNH